MTCRRKLDVALASRTELVILPTLESLEGLLAYLLLGIEFCLTSMIGESGEGNSVGVQIFLADQTSGAFTLFAEADLGLVSAIGRGFYSLAGEVLVRAVDAQV